MDLDNLRTKYRHHILALADKHKAENVRVFGSVARGQATSGSDVDFLVHFLPQASLLDLVGLENALADLLGEKVDVLDDSAIRDAFVPFILAEAVSL